MDPHIPLVPRPSLLLSLSSPSSPNHFQQEEEEEERIAQPKSAKLHLMDKELTKEIHEQVCRLCRSQIACHQAEGLFISCNECGFLGCQTCYEYFQKVGNQACRTCHKIYEKHTGNYSVVSDELQCTGDSWECNSRYIQGLKSNKVLFYSLNHRRVQDLEISQFPRRVATPLDAPQKKTIQKVEREHAELPVYFVNKCTLSYSSPGISGRIADQFNSVPCCPVPPRKTLHPQALSLMSYKAPFWRDRLQLWKLAQQNISCRTDCQKTFSEVGESIPPTEVNDYSPFTEANESSCLTEVELDQLEKDEELRQLLSRKVPIPSSKINPYRVVILFRLVTLAFYLRYRLVNPIQNAYGLWLTSVLCESWFSLSWVLDQLPKLQPIRRETYPERLCLRYNHPGNQCQLACVDVFISTLDPLKEPPLVISNTILSILAVDYPTEKVTCYVSDDGASLLTLETLLETCQFARRWVPFCRKFNIEPRSPECYFSHKVDYLKNNIFPTFAKERRAMKRQYEEFKVHINGLVAKFQNIPSDGWAMRDGTPWPGNNTHDHPGMIQILLGQSGPRDCEDKELPQLVYVSREMRPGYQHNKMAGAMNSLVRVSAILTNGSYILDLNYDHYINNSRAFLEAMCFMMDPKMTNKACFVQFPQKFDGINKSDPYADNHSVFYDINLKALDGIQGPIYIGTGCFFNRKALYGYDPASKSRCSRLRLHESWKKKLHGDRGYAFIHYLEEDDLSLFNMEPTSLESENSSLIQSLKKCFGESSSLIASIVVKDDSSSHSMTTEGHLKDAIHVISCDYEKDTVWGREIGWIYGSLNSHILTSLKMHAHGWRSIYCMPSRPAFRASAPIKLSERLNQVLHGAVGSVEILFSRHCPIWYAHGSRLKLLERVAYISATVYPLTSIPLVIYCTLPAICLITGKFILPQISSVGSMWLTLVLFSIFATGVLEMRWSGVGAQEWWRNQQFWVIGGVSSDLFAVIYGSINILMGKRVELTILTESSVEDDLMGIYALRWTSLMILPTTIILINLWAMVGGISSALNDRYISWGLLFAKMVYSFLVIIHLYPFLKGLVVRQHRIPTVVIVWSLLLAALFSMLWVRVNPFITKFQGPNDRNCGIYC